MPDLPTARGLVDGGLFLGNALVGVIQARTLGATLAAVNGC